MRKKTYFITGGGTGGHIYPAVAVADNLYEKDDTKKIYYVGNPKNLEFDIVSQKPYDFLPVLSYGMPRKVSFKFLFWVCSMFFALIKCCFYILKYKPDVIFGTGGYVSAPILMAGVIMKIPFVMHDCDANPGLVTRKLAPFANSISVAFEIAKDKLNNNKCILNGNPIRSEFSLYSRQMARNELGMKDKLTLCIMGGSQGAKKINSAAVEILKTLSKDLNLQVIFQTGKKNYIEVLDLLKEKYPEFSQDSNIILQPYFDNMPLILKSSDIAVSRAGSLSISEICASSIAAIFVPYPYAAADHQRKNAKFMVEQGAGLYLEDEDTNPENLLNLVNELVQNPEKCKLIQEKSFSMAKLNSVESIVKQIQSCV